MDENYFKFFNLSQETLQGLEMSNFVKTTEIQKQSLKYSLEGKDVLGAAKTGSGKTLAFIIPVLEKLYKEKWTPFDGLGALIISPTRELALQIFKVLRDVGKKHSFSAGLLIGGKNLKQEQERVGRMNILVATPGRLLQHMDQTPEFDCLNLQILVLDEADRILDSGFEKTLNAIIENLPQRQTLLFSATQTKAVKDLARLSVKDAEYISVHEAAKTSTPRKLVQHYIECELQQKLDILWSFIRTHLKQKTLVFLSSGKQVRFVFEAFCKMQPGIPLMCLHGKQNQQKRIAIFEQFSRKTQACLFATDIAARGLDIPAVDWVFQVDCPDDAATYIHRVGRTARNEASGNALMLLLPSEKEGMLKELQQKKVVIEEIKMNPAKAQSIKGQLASLCSSSPDMKYLAQKAFITYLRSIFLQSNKAIFDVHSLPHDEYAESLGLPGAPHIKFKKHGNSKNNSRQIEALDNKSIKIPSNPINGKKKALTIAHASSDDEEEEKNADSSKKPKTRIDKLFAQKNLTVLSSHYAKLKEVDEESDDDLITLARKDHDVSDDEITLVRKKKGTKVQRAKQSLGLGKKLVFDDDGNMYDPFTMQSVQEFAPTEEVVARKQQEFLFENTETMKQADAIDKNVEKSKRREIKLARKIKEKAIRREESGYQGPFSIDDTTLKDEYSDVEDRGEDQTDYSSAHGQDSDDDSDSDRIVKRQKLESMESLMLPFYIVNEASEASHRCKSPTIVEVPTTKALARKNMLKLKLLIKFIMRSVKKKHFSKLFQDLMKRDPSFETRVRVSKKEMERRPSDASLFNPLEDPHFSDTIQDFLTIFNPQEMEEKPYLQNYVIELLARWGRWVSRGRAPALCFEAACVGGLSFLKRRGRQPCKLTARADAALARLLAGMVIDAVEPMARKQGGPAREKAIGIVADEFLAKTASSNPSVANSAKKRMKKRRTLIKVSESEDLLREKRNPDPRRPSVDTNNSHRLMVGFDRKPSLYDGSPYSNAGYNMQQRSDSDYSSRNGLITNADPSHLYGRGRKFSKDDHAINQQPRFPPGNQRIRQFSVPLATNAEPQSYSEQSRSRQNSEGGWDNRFNQYFVESKILAGQKSRKPSLEGLQSSLSSVGQISEYSDKMTQSRPRKSSADSSLGRSDYVQNVYADMSNSDIGVRPRKSSWDDTPPLRNRSESVDRELNASRYDGDNRSGNSHSRQQFVSPPITGAGKRRPSQQAKQYQQQQPQRIRHPSNNNEEQFDRQYVNKQRESPPKISNANSRGANFSARQPESDFGYRSPQMHRDIGRRPSQESDEIRSRRPSYEEYQMHNRIGSNSSHRQLDDRPSRSRNPTLENNRNANPGQYGQPNESVNRAKTGNSSKRVDDLGNFLQNMFFDSPKKN